MPRLLFPFLFFLFYSTYLYTYLYTYLSPIPTMSQDPWKEVTNHVRRIHNSYYFDTYKDLSRSIESLEELTNNSSSALPAAASEGGNGSTHPHPGEISSPVPFADAALQREHMKLLELDWARRRNGGFGTMQDAIITSGNGNRALTEAVALVLGVHTHDISVVHFESGEVHVNFQAPVLGKDVYIIQSTGSNSLIDVNSAIMELLLLVRKLRLKHAKSITAIIPYFGYGRQDSKRDLRGAVPAAAVARMITRMGVDRIATLDLHSSQTQGYFDNSPLDNLVMVYEFEKYIRKQPWFDPELTAVVAPDSRGVERARQLADLLSVGRIITIIRRIVTGPDGKTRTAVETAGHVQGLRCIILDDLIDTAETLVEACELLKSLGATQVMACSSHGSFSHPAETRIMECDVLTEVVVSDSLPQEEHQRLIPKLKVLSIAPLLASVIRTYDKGLSLACLFPSEEKK